MNYRKDLVPGIVLAFFSIIYLVMATQIETFSGSGATAMNARTIPYFWGGCLLLLSLILVVRGLKARKKELAENGGKAVKGEGNFLKDNREIILTFILLAIYIALLEPVGFLIMTAVYLIGQILILTPKDKRTGKRSIIITVVVSVAAAFIIDYVFVCLLKVMLPLGIFGF